ncbi:TetR family transcriptional regulator C-terminal domain-containing protein [Acidisoma cellulosilytica]|uniref:TetR family transcriptional regulator C-terminal domain-containing protein n=1 Tax=Acidisoma cellulosilyticum TaxID=2802395 RepID=A0A964E2J3_9PROT|nr:TetR/AcrR family transcriptional regulator [Acidisoma cellulosilyticum]MCB8879359.1 TetR family transcriptional regulator C-terminal domain-containing protein [Acidisoma cellulosilyticum]
MISEHQTRTALISEGLKALIANGYDGVGIGPILTAAGVPRGSFYYFFKSKEEFAVAVLEAYHRHYQDLHAPLLDDAALSPSQRLRDYFDDLERIHLAETPLGGCLYGVFAQTVSARSAAFRDKLASIFAIWAAQLAKLLETAQTMGEIDPTLDPKEAAGFLIEAYEGALIRMKVDGNAVGFDRFRRFALEPILAKPG